MEVSVVSPKTVQHEAHHKRQWVVPAGHTEASRLEVAREILHELVVVMCVEHQRPVLVVPDLQV